ncbi:MAG: hypothetical protein R2844_13005 [Caldilineales bacterium]
MNTATTQQIIDQIRSLPPESLDDLAVYVDFLRFKASQAGDAEPGEKPLRVINLRGILRGHDFSPEALAEARHEMWHSLETSEP